MPLRRVEAHILAPAAHEQQKQLRVAAHDATTLLPIRAVANAPLQAEAHQAHARTIAIAHRAVAVHHRVASLRAVARALLQEEASLLAEAEVAVQVAVVVHVAADDKQSINI